MKRAVSWENGMSNSSDENGKQKTRASSPPVFKFNNKLQRPVHSHSVDNSNVLLNAHNRTKKLEERKSTDAPVDEVLPSKPAKMRNHKLSATNYAPPIPMPAMISTSSISSENDAVISESPVDLEPSISPETMLALQTTLPVPEQRKYMPITRNLSRRFVSMPENVRIYAAKTDIKNEKQLETDPDLPLLREMKRRSESENDKPESPSTIPATRAWSYNTSVKLLGKEEAERVQQNVLNFRNSLTSSGASLRSGSVNESDRNLENEEPAIQRKLTANEFSPPLPDLSSQRSRSPEVHESKFESLSRRFTSLSRFISPRSSSEQLEGSTSSKRDQRPKSIQSLKIGKRNSTKVKEQNTDTRSELSTDVRSSIGEPTDSRGTSIEHPKRMTAEFYRPPMPSMPDVPRSRRSTFSSRREGNMSFFETIKRKLSVLSLKYRARSKSAAPRSKSAEPRLNGLPTQSPEPTIYSENAESQIKETAFVDKPDETLKRTYPSLKPSLTVSTVLHDRIPYQRSPSPLTPVKPISRPASSSKLSKGKEQNEAGTSIPSWNRPTAQQILEEMDKWVPDVHKWECEPGHDSKMFCKEVADGADCNEWKQKMAKISPNLIITTNQITKNVSDALISTSTSEIETAFLDDTVSEHTLAEESSVSRIFIPQRVSQIAEEAPPKKSKTRSFGVPGDSVISDPGHIQSEEPMEMDENTAKISTPTKKPHASSDGQVTGGTEGVGFVSNESDGLPIRITWVRGQKLGSGAFATVYLGMCKTTSELMAVKQVNYVAPRIPGRKEKIKQRVIDALHIEIALLKELNHPNVVKYYGYDVTDTTVSIFLEYVDGGSITSLVSRMGTFPLEMTQSITFQVLQGLSYLHERLIIHRDIKGGNILLTASGIAKIADFGISKKSDQGYAYRPDMGMSFRGSIPWMAPEVVKPNGYSAKIDVWSLGCVVLEMSAGQLPWNQQFQMNENQIIYQLGKAKAPPIPEFVTNEDTRTFLNKCLTIDAADRPEVNELLKHPFITKFNPETFDFEASYTESVQRYLKNKHRDDEDEDDDYGETTFDNDVPTLDGDIIM
ncbi:hypothetical protein HK098_007659 [Nowakowskiella sp. JEL0407]|nr:hypothetical protein HK098_007659 [Nowakowskiella sp. JEL0407]